MVMAVAAFTIPLTMFVRAASANGVAVSGEPVEVHAAGGRTWGIYFNDADNSGYTTSCNVTDRNGRQVPIRPAGMTITSSDTEMLDLLFRVPDDGWFVAQCAAEGAEARVGPVGNVSLLAGGVVAAMFLGIGGVVAGSLWFARRSRVAHSLPA